MFSAMSLLAQSQYDDGSTRVAAAASGMIIVFVLIALAIAAFVLIMWWKIFSKAGYSGAMALLLLIPIANLVALCVLAFGDWPLLREVRALRAQVGGGGQYLPPQGYPQQAGYPAAVPPQHQRPPGA